MIKNVLNKLGFVRIALVASAGFPFIVASNAFAQAAPPPLAAQVGAPSGIGAAAPAAEVERVLFPGGEAVAAERHGPDELVGAALRCEHGLVPAVLLRRCSDERADVRSAARDEQQAGVEPVHRPDCRRP